MRQIGQRFEKTVMFYEFEFREDHRKGQRLKQKSCWLEQRTQVPKQPINQASKMNQTKIENKEKNERKESTH